MNKRRSLLRPVATRALFSALCVFSAAAFAAGSAQAQGGPNLSLMVGFGAGGSADSIARIVGSRLGEKLGRNVIVENRPGAGANIATKLVVQANPDGNTLLVTTAALPINETLYRNKGFSAPSLMPIAIVATTPEVFAINVNDKAKTIKEFVEENKNEEIHFATAGIGTGSHIAAEYFFKFLVKANAKHVPFRGGPDATNAVLGGHVPMVVSPLSGFAAQVAGGKLRGLAVAQEGRNPVIKDVPTFAEAGFPGFTSLSWVGFFAPPGTPKDKVAQYNKEINEIIKEPAIAAKLKALGFDPMINAIPETDAFMTKEYAHWKKLVEALNLHID